MAFEPAALAVLIEPALDMDPALTPVNPMIDSDLEKPLVGLGGLE